LKKAFLTLFIIIAACGAAIFLGLTVGPSVDNATNKAMEEIPWLFDFVGDHILSLIGVLLIIAGLIYLFAWITKRNRQLDDDGEEPLELNGDYSPIPKLKPNKRGVNL